MTNILITGANRGLGLELARQYAESGDTVHACCREPAKASYLKALAGAHKNLHLHQMDVGDGESIARTAREIAEPIDILINNAGIGGNGGRDPDHMDYAYWEEILRINTIAPYRVAEAFHDHLKNSDAPKLVTISSGMGVTSHHNGEAFAYRSSKAALNNIMHGLAKRWGRDKIIVTLVSPGWVRTDMGGPNAPLSPQESVAGMRKVIAGLKSTESGKHLDYLGREMPW